MSYLKNNIEAMVPYVPGEQPRSGERVIKLNTNENPYPPSPKALEAIRGFDGTVLRRYPDPLASGFRQGVAEVLNVPAEWVLPGDGSDDLIVMISRACLGKDRPVVYPVPTFAFYETQALIEGAGLLAVPLNDDFTLPVEKLIEAKGTVTFVANPNSPTGLAATNAELKALAQRLSGVLVIDEAYTDFAEDNALELVQEHDNVIVLRTLSKGYSLAALRLGFGICSPELMQGLLKTKSIYNVGALPEAVGAAAVADQDYKNACVAKIKASRTELISDLKALGFEVMPSQANFVLASVPYGKAQALHDALRARRILVRYYNKPPLDDKLRITVGTDEENAALITAMDEIL
jgi:histidinol-phosphate aminotransferase